RRSFGRLLAGLHTFGEEQRSDLAADLLRRVRIARLEEDEEAGKPAAAGDLGTNGLDLDVFTNLIDAAVHVAAGACGAAEVVLLDDRLQPRAAEDLLLHRSQTAVEICLDDRLDALVGHFG